MSNLFRTAAVAVALSTGGCAIHPLPEDVTGVPTYIISRKIRCEAREAIKDNLTQWLTAQDSDPAAKAIGLALLDGTLPLSAFSAKLFQGDVRTIIEKFQNSAIAYDFSFDMTETDFIDGTLGLTRILKHSTFTAPISGGVDRTRENIRTFTITDTFIKLLTTVKDDYCTEFTYDKNYLYPVTGKIGVGEMIHTFVELSLFANLAAKSGPPTMTDAITFTTKLSASSTPAIVLTPVTSALQLANASLTPAFTRNDVHKVIVALSLPVPPTASTTSTTAKTATAAPPKVGLFVSASGTAAELSAAHAIEQAITRFELGKTAVVVPGP